MNELALQKLMCDAVNDAGGYAVKRNNRFMVGIVDLLVKLPQQRSVNFASSVKDNPPAGILEVKQRQWPKSDAPFELDLTHMQMRDLQRAHDAGMPTGIASFLCDGSGSGLKLSLQVRTWRGSTIILKKGGQEGASVWTERRHHLLLGPKATRHNDILFALYKWQREWREGK